jgi:hypothetical protein
VYSIGVAELETMLQVQSDKLRASTRKAADIQLALQKSTAVPYLDADGEAMLIAVRSEPASSHVGASCDDKKNENITCGVECCNEVFSRSEMRQHAGWHILVASGQQKMTVEMPCGLCAARPSAQCVSVTGPAQDAPRG